jgi:hypothetical protein
MALPLRSNTLPKARRHSFSVNRRLTPSEIASLRRNAQEIHRQAKGKFLDLKGRVGKGKQGLKPVCVLQDSGGKSAAGWVWCPANGGCSGTLNFQC